MSKGFVSGLMTGICYLALQTGAYSQEQKEPEELGPIIVTAARGEQSLDEVTRSVAVVDSEQIERASTNSVAEILRDVPGVKIIDSGVPGMQRISIRGESSIRNVVLIDGQEISDHTSYGPLFLIAAEDIERIEVVKGPGSVLHGSKAIGGVVNIITKKGADRPLEVEVGTKFNSSTNGISGFASAAGTIDKWDYRVSFSRAYDGDRETPAGTLDPSASSEQSATAYIGYRGDQHSFSLKAERYELEADVYTGDPDFPFDLPKRDRSKLSIFYDFEDVNEYISKIHLDGFFQQIDRVAENGYTIPEIAFPPTNPPTITKMKQRDNHIESELQTLGLNGQVDLALFNNVVTLVGFQAVQDRLDRQSSQTGMDIPFPPGPPNFPTPITPTSTDDEGKVTTLSAFVQNEWDVTDDLTLTSGSRYYFVKTENKGSAGDRDETDQAVVGAVGLNYTGFDDFALRASVAQGYVYPTLIQTMIGTNFSPAGMVFSNPDLEAETSVTAELGGRYDDGQLMLDAAVFYTQAKDYITTVSCDNVACPIGSLMYDNINEARTWGLELSASYRISDWSLTPYANLTLMRRQFEEADLTTFHTNTPLVSGSVGVKKDWSLSNGVEAHADMYARFASKHTDLDRSNEVVTEDAFATLNLAGGFSYDFDDERKLKVNAAVENIFDLEYKPSLDELTAPGRTFKLSASVIF
ncbi:TonB-dependent heme/hemoglobin receptor family protein [Pseudovibrio sp. FO-BEG1]|uniref:TonB-dependent receptor n=1 Tax=Pseudovibrio sp. (strain FO-BEG1) TaxID=911045 RepID=UPI000238C76C|nr:TonB-dependent receptor [Pseudovibrio sp. FO-BEG1]AEV39040.1 TonB-dependent heme/hemoglobin receptor family protein [Pseudovibrio sp. FO-BEG1]